MLLAPLALLVSIGVVQQVPAASFSPRPDSQSLHRHARRAQAGFETFRRRNLPNVNGRSGGPCDVMIGRFCYWYDETEPQPPAEPAGIARARLALSDSLDAAASLLPGDAWIAGQRIWYLIESKRHADASAAARECQAERWWCLALAGLVFHTAGNYAKADSVFAAAVQGMPESERCRWTDISMLVAGPLRKRYRATSCADREVMDARLWWLGRPFHSIAGNDLRTEHFARLTVSRLLEDARTSHGLSWGRDVEEMLIRYGWPTSWSRDRAKESMAPSGSAPEHVVGHEATPSYYFFPDAEAVDRPMRALPGHWRLREPFAPSRYAPVYGAPIVPLDHQIAVFRRADSMLVVAAFDVSRDTLFQDQALDAALVLSRDERSDPVITRAPRIGPRLVLGATAPRDAHLFSLELLAPERKRAARARYALAPDTSRDGALAISDLLLFDAPAPASLPSRLDAAIPGMLGASRMRAGESVGLLWEIYGLRASETSVLNVTLTLERTRISRGRKFTEFLRLRDRTAPVRMRWQAAVAPDTNGIATGAVVVGLDNRPPGTYRLEVVVAALDGTTAVASREIEIAKRGPRPGLQEH